MTVLQGFVVSWSSRCTSMRVHFRKTHQSGCTGGRYCTIQFKIFWFQKKIRGRWQIVFSLYDLLSGRRERQCIRHIQQNSWFQKHSKTIYCGLLMYVPVEQRRCPGFEFYMCMFLVQPKLCDEGFIHSLIYSGNYWWLQGYNVERFLFVYNCSSATRTCGGYLCSWMWTWTETNLQLRDYTL